MKLFLALALGFAAVFAASSAAGLCVLLFTSTKVARSPPACAGSHTD